MNSMEAPNPIDENNLIYGWKVVAHIVMIVGLVMFLFTMAGLLIDSSLFSSLKLQQPAKEPGFAYRSKGWWICALILTLIPVAFFFPGTAIGNKMPSNALFQLGTTPNGYLIWTLLAACGMLVFLLVYHFAFGKKQGLNAASYGLATSDSGKFSLGHIVKSAVLALVLFMMAYYVLMLLYRYANTDLHVWTNSLRLFNGTRAATMPWYFVGLLPYFALCNLAGCTLKFNGDTTQGKGLAKAVLIGSLVGLVGMIVLLGYHEVYLRLNRPFYTGNFAHFYLDLLTNVLPQFAIASALANYIKRKTNSCYAGILIGTAMVAFGMVSTNSIAMIIS